jgi:ribonuclease HII
LEATLRAQGFTRIAGADEAGRGACAGPLVAAAVILPPDYDIPELRDSKLLTAKARERVYAQVTAVAQWAVVEISPAECDELGMQEADLAGLRRSLLRLAPPPDFALTDGFAVPGLPFPALGVIKGDQVAPSVSAASVIAKVTRDRIMGGLALAYPGYGFEVHKGYCTKAHQQRLEAQGVSAVHRRSYANIQAILAGTR